MRDSNPHAREQLILSQPCLPFHQFPVNNMVGAARFELAMIVTSAHVTIVPRCAGLCIPVPPSAYKIPNQSLEKYSGVLAPTSSMLFLARQCLIERAMYRALWNCSLGRKFNFHFGWGRRNRTYILGTKNPCLTVRRYPNLVGVAGF